MSEVRTYEVDNGAFVVASGGVWCPGIFDSAETAERAVRDFTDDELRQIDDVWRRHGTENRPATMADLDRIVKASVPVTALHSGPLPGRGIPLSLEDKHAALTREAARLKAGNDELELVCTALAKLVREEYPPLPLAEIAFTWGEATFDEIAALAVWDAKVNAVKNPCPVCGLPASGETTMAHTDLAWHTFTDSEGREHDHDPNGTGLFHICRNDHEWCDATCWCGYGAGVLKEREPPPNP